MQTGQSEHPRSPVGKPAGVLAMKTLILCGGKGTRLSAHSEAMPKALVEVGRARDVLDIVRETFPEHVSRTFESVVRDALLRRGPWRSVAPWWDRKGENEIDAIALDEKAGRALFAEAKWTGRKVGWESVQDLIRKSDLAPVDARMERSYLVASRSGFTTSCMDHMDSEGILHWGLDDLGVLATTHP